MSYQFALIESKFSINIKKWLIGFAFVVLFIGGSSLATFIFLNFKLSVTVYMVYIGFIVILFYIFIIKVIDSYKIKGTVSLAKNGITINTSNQFINYKDIVLFYYLPSAALGGTTRESVDTYFLQIVKKDMSIENIHVTRSQFDNNKFKKAFLWKKHDDLFDSLKKTGVTYTYKKNKYIGNKR